jgi:hypothetical protein
VLARATSVANEVAVRTLLGVAAARVDVALETFGTANGASAGSRAVYGAIALTGDVAVARARAVDRRVIADLDVAVPGAGAVDVTPLVAVELAAPRASALEPALGDAENSAVARAGTHALVAGALAVTAVDGVSDFAVAIATIVVIQIAVTTGDIGE